MTDSADPELEHCRRRVGSTLRDKWHIDDVIGVGGMAAVYSATHRIGRRDAIKILHPEIAVSKELRKRFEQEARAVSQLGHAATVQVRDIDVTEDGAPFMVMELLEGESLGARAFRLGGIPEQELLRYVATVLDVLNAAHERGIVHRDIKPDNLFITSTGEVRVLDFGIAHMKQGGAAALRTRTGALLGTTPYMAPEQILGRPIDGRADLYALGASMFRILAKRKIHEAESEAELLMQMGTMPAPSLRAVAPQISARVSLIVDRALAFDRDARYPSAAAMSADVQAVLGNEDPALASASARAWDTPTRPHASPPLPLVAAASPPQPDRKKPAALSLPTIVGIGAVLIVLAGTIAVSVLIGDCAGATKSKTAARDYEDDDAPLESRASASASASAAAIPSEKAQGGPIGEKKGKSKRDSEKAREKELEKQREREEGDD